MEDKTTIPLSQENRELLLKYEPYFANHDLFRMVSIAVKKGKNYELYFTEEQLDEFLEQLAELCNNEEDEETQYALDDIHDSFEQYSDIYAEDDYSEYSNNTGSVCVLKVFLAGSKKIWRKIEIREGQTLHNLHDIIFDAFDRDDEHMYSFFFPHSRMKFNPRKIYDSSDEYTHPSACEYQGPFSSEGKDASKTTIGSLNLTEGQVFFYVFDFGDEWWHEIIVEKIDGVADDGDYPRIIEQKGESPEQYDYDEDEE
jgi:hypothetical protein